MNRRNDSPGEFHPGNPGFRDSIPDQYGQEHYEHSQYGPGSYGQGQHSQGQHSQRQYSQREYEQGPSQGPYSDRRYAAGSQYGQGRYAPDQHAQRQYGHRPDTSGQYSQDQYGQDQYDQRRGDYPARSAADYRTSAGQPPLAQQPFGHAPFSHAEFGESNEPRYFGTGAQGYGGGPSFTGGTYGYADARSDSPYFQDARFNRGYYEDSLERAAHPHDDPYRRELRPPQRRRYAMGPKGYKRSDERLREDISERLMQAYHIDSSEVTVEVLGGKVVLEGTVPDRYMKHAIEDLADAAPGVEDVENRIRVGSAASTSSSK